MKPYVSGTGSPMYYTARIAKQKYPNAKVVFIGPCIAKRKEAQRDECVDYVLTFEELHPMFRGLGIELEQANPYKVAYESVCEAHGFAQAGGVAGAVKAYLARKPTASRLCSSLTSRRRTSVYSALTPRPEKWMHSSSK